MDSPYDQKVRIALFLFFRSANYIFYTLPATPGKNFRFDYLATKTRAIIVPSCGIDSVPADVIVHLASKTLDHAPLGASMTSASLRGGVPGGTIASFLTACEDVPLDHLRLSARDWALSPVPGARSPRPSLVHRLGPGSRIVGGVSLFERINRAIVQRTAGLRELARREARLCGAGGADASADPACYGPAFTYAEFMPTGSAVSAIGFSLVIGLLFATLTFIAPVRVVDCQLTRAKPHHQFFFHYRSGGCSSVW
jgi:hypothetical protein